MNRPYVICHILSSLDGRINGPFMSSEAARALGGEYGKLRAGMNADAWLYGTTTAKEFLNFREPALAEGAQVPEGDFVAGDETKPYFVALDAKGELGWESGRFANKGRAEAHVIEILTQAAPLSYRAYLRERGVSYLLAGEAELDCGMAMEKLYRLFGIEKLLICGGWGQTTSTSTTSMGTPDSPHPFKHIVDHAIQDGKIQPLIIVLPTYNNTSGEDSGNYSLALRLTGNFHNELVNDLIPAVESKYSTYAESTDEAGLAASRDHRAFGGFSMGSMNTWHTFEYCLDYFRYFAPSSGGPIGNGEAMADIVGRSGHSPEDFFLFTASGTEDFAYSGFKSGVMDMAKTDVFTLADSEAEGNLSFREREGYAHDGNAANEYMYNALRFFWNA